MPQRPNRKDPRINTYTPTADGKRIAVFYAKVHNRLLSPLIAADRPPAPVDLRTLLRRRQCQKLCAERLNLSLNRCRISTLHWHEESQATAPKPCSSATPYNRPSVERAETPRRARHSTRWPRAARSPTSCSDGHQSQLVDPRQRGITLADQAVRKSRNIPRQRTRNPGRCNLTFRRTHQILLHQ